MPSSHVLFRWISPVDRTTVQIGPNGLVPATQSCGAPEKYRTLAWRPSTITARSCASIWASALLRRLILKARSSGRISSAIGGVGVVGQRHEAVFGDNGDLLASIAAGAVLPDHRLQNEHHPGREHEVVVELLAEIRSDHWHFSGIGADAVAEIEVRQPRLLPAVGGDRGPGQITGRRARLRHLQYRIEDVAPVPEPVQLTGRRGLGDAPGPPRTRVPHRGALRQGTGGPPRGASRRSARRLRRLRPPG